MTYLAQNINFSRGTRTILQDVSFEIRRACVTTMIGPNGAGKSTLLKMMAGELAPDAGELRLNERPISEWSPKELAQLRAVVPQSPSLSFDFLVQEVVQMGLIGKPKDRLVDQALHDVGLQRQAAQKYTSLSGGEKQRVHLARALVQVLSSENTSPPFFLLDEPSASLDLIYTEKLMNLISDLSNNGVGVFMIMHDVNLASVWSDQILILHEGTILAEGPPESVIHAENLERCFNVNASIIPHPQTGRPVMLPVAPHQID